MVAYGYIISLGGGIFNSKEGEFRKKIKPDKNRALGWRKRWDSNPRYREVQLISSQSRYDHFDTLPKCYSYIIQQIMPFVKEKFLPLRFPAVFSEMP